MELPSEKEWVIFMADVGKLLSRKLLPIYTPTSNVGVYLSIIFSPTLTYYTLGKNNF